MYRFLLLHYLLFRNFDFFIVFRLFLPVSHFIRHDRNLRNRKKKFFLEN